ncbi:heme ABC transporter ATP-binding protein [Pelagibacterium lentulum]|uniref:Hemin import ATP-binding protein HmuV n=1 Tax=Pelagibacterium lentulum TaxID=2029865 RepID=A0A916R675_9HYPH|nr:heme ABC transporter ATP-binding protein [Pelagibacterium lentulum]GGA39000.1 hemin import ATP-binding protein HmuV [Pelagibacterium lentulum]
MYQAQNITYAIAGRPILRKVDFTARPGEVTVIVGPNGSGKTTLLKALTGEINAGGDVSINGISTKALKPYQAAALRAVLPQSSVLTFPFSVHEVVRLGLSGGVAGVSATDAERLPERALARVDMSGFGGRYYSELSGGEQQRVQLARVLCQVWEPVLDGQPRYLLLDEPISSLDVRHQLHIMDIARDYANAGGGVIAILHDLNLAAMYADSIGVMSRGGMVAQGGCQDVLSNTLIESVFGCPMQLGVVPPGNAPFVLPQSARRYA